ncbi:MAG TPA: ribonuclease H-like domain-containing protein, partial [Candidatus Eisenbacteria bacterium]|nr:ribonuclease H-like domain-containing protein [Candidatus Eisenbacteria bacterium]
MSAVGLERRLANFRSGRPAIPAGGPAISELARRSTIGAERLAASVDGELVRTPRGAYVRVEAPSTILPLDRPRLAGLPGQPPPGAPLLCLDTETTGLATAAGTLAFLVGLGWWEGSRFRQVQLLLPDHADEPALLDELARRIPPDGWLVTYNGRGFDWPLLVARFRLVRAAPPIHAGHLDLLPLVRRVFKHRMPDARLRSAETVLLGLHRIGDVEGWEIPGRYLEFLRSGEPTRLLDVVRHNDEDVRSLARLLVHVDQGYADRERWPEAPAGDLAGLARAFSSHGRIAEALACIEAAIEAPPASAPSAPVAPLRPLAPAEPRRAPVDPDDDGPWWSPRRRPDFGGRPGRHASTGSWPAAEGSRLDAPWTEVRLSVERARLLRRLGRYREAEETWLRVADRGGTLAILAWIEVAKLREHRFADHEAALAAARMAQRLAERQRWLGGWLVRVDGELARRAARLIRRIAAAQRLAAKRV